MYPIIPMIDNQEFWNPDNVESLPLLVDGSSIICEKNRSSVSHIYISSLEIDHFVIFVVYDRSLSRSRTIRTNTSIGETLAEELSTREISTFRSIVSFSFSISSSQEHAQTPSPRAIFLAGNDQSRTIRELLALVRASRYFLREILLII